MNICDKNSKNKEESHIKKEKKMKKRDVNEQNSWFYDEDGVNQVTAQIMDSYSSGIVGEPAQDSQTEGNTYS